MTREVYIFFKGVEVFFVCNRGGCYPPFIIYYVANTWIGSLYLTLVQLNNNIFYFQEEQCSQHILKILQDVGEDFCFAQSAKLLSSDKEKSKCQSFFYINTVLLM